MGHVICIVERSDGALEGPVVEGPVVEDTAWELLGAARVLAGEGGRVGAALLGTDLGGLSAELARGFDDVWVFDDPRLAAWDGDGYARVLAPLLAREKPDFALLVHSNLGIDLAPGLSVRADMALLPDCLTLERNEEGVEATRAVYGGKVHARLRTAFDGGVMATLRAGAFAAAPPVADGGGAVHAEAVPEGLETARRFVKTVRPEAGEVDITQADILVGVGRGIEEDENLEIVESLAKALGGEVACSRPVVDKGWLPKSRQIGTSGLTVKPRVYVAVGISGSFQHIGGIKGSPYIVAINKDPRAPIFGVADVGIVGDLFDIVPELEEKIRQAKA